MIILRNINIEYNHITLIKQESLLFEDGKFYVLSGPSGCGKTSLLYQLGLISNQSFCDYYYNDYKIETNTDKEWVRKNEIAYIFQDKNLQEDLTVYQNLSCYSMISGDSLSRDEAKEYLKMVNLDVDLDHLASKLSGGEKQRLAIACALSKKTQVIIADEPTSSLDKTNKQLITSVLLNLTKNYGKTVVVASHDKCFLELNEIQYRIENNKIQIDCTNSVSEKKKFSLKKINSKFYSTILGYKKHIYVQSLRKILLLSFFIIGLNAMLLSVNQTILNSYIQKLKQLAPNEIKITNLDSKEDLDYISKMDSVIEVKPYYEVLPDSIEETELKDAVIHFYYPDDLIRFNKLKDKQTNQVYLNYSYKDYDKDTLHLGLFGQDYTFKISGILDNNIEDVYGSGLQNIIYLPIEYAKESLMTSYYIVEVADVKSIDVTMNKILTLNSNLNVSSEYRDVDALLQVQKNISLFVRLGAIVLTIVVVISSSLSQVLEMNNRIYEMSVFKANGLQNKNLFKLESIRLTYLYSIGSGILIIIGMIILFILNLILHLNDPYVLIRYVICVLIIGIISIIFPLLISWRHISKISMEEILRK